MTSQPVRNMPENKRSLALMYVTLFNVEINPLIISNTHSAADSNYGRPSAYWELYYQLALGTDSQHQDLSIPFSLARSRKRCCFPRWGRSSNLHVLVQHYLSSEMKTDVDLSDEEDIVRFKTSAPVRWCHHHSAYCWNVHEVHVDEAKRYLERLTAIKDGNAIAEDAMRIAGCSRSSGDALDGGNNEDAAARLFLRLMVLQKASRR